MTDTPPFNLADGLAGLSLRCPRCGSPAARDPKGFVCSRCETVFPERNGTIDFMPRRGQAPALVNADTLVSRIMTSFALPAQSRPEVELAVDATRDRTGIDYIDAEISTLGLRFGEEERNAPPPEADRNASIFVTRHYIASGLPAGSRVYRSFRLQAVGTLNGDVAGLGYRWEHSSGPRRFAGKIRDGLGLNSPPHGAARFPIPIIHSGREITLPLELRTPRRHGRYDLHVFPIGAPGTGLTVRAIEIGGVARDPAPDGDPVVDYAEDHKRGVDFIGQHLPAEPIAILEVAAGVNPHMLEAALKGHRVIAADVCSNQMQVGAIFSRYRLPHEISRNLTFVSCDATNAPFALASFGCAVMFSALHHFPDPAGFLRDLARLVRPGGFIGVLCEPCAPELAAASPAYVRDLAAGINAQMFAVEEYRDIFAAAGLSEVALRDDQGSLKAVLRV